MSNFITNQKDHKTVAGRLRALMVLTIGHAVYNSFGLGESEIAIVKGERQ